MNSMAFRRTITFFLVAGITAGQGVISTLVGTDWVFPLSSTPALSAPLGSIRGVAVDRDGNVFGSDCDNHLIFRVNSGGTLSIVAGNGVSGNGLSVDGPAAGARLNCPYNLFFDGTGDLWFLDGLIRKLTKDGRLVTVAGLGTNSEEGIPAVQASLSPTGFAIDAEGNIYVSEGFQSRVRKIGTDGLIRTIAGTGEFGFSGDGASALLAKLSFPSGIAVASNGTVYVCDLYNGRVRTIAADGTIRTFAAALPRPEAVFAEADGSVIIVDSVQGLRRVGLDGVISNLAGSSVGFSGDGGAAAEAALRSPTAVAIDVAGNLFIADSGNSRIRKVDVTGRITTLAGNGNWRRTPDISNPLTAWLLRPRDMAISPAGLVTFSDAYDVGTIRQLNPEGQLVRLAGSLMGSGDPDASLTTYLGFTPRIAFDKSGNIFVTVSGLTQQSSICAVKKLSPDGRVSFVAGRVRCGFSGDEGPATAATLGCPRGIAVSEVGELFISDTCNLRIRKVDRSGIIHTIAGNGTSGFAGDGGPAVNAMLRSPDSILVDFMGNIVFSDIDRVRSISPDGTIKTIAGGGKPGFVGDNGPATEASLQAAGLALDSAGNLYIADPLHSRIRVVSPAGVISTFAGSGVPNFTGDGGPPLSATFRSPYGVVVDALGKVYIADTGNERIRMVQRPPATFGISTSSVILTTSGSGSVPPAEIRLNGSIAGLNFTSAVTTAGGGGWLSASPSRGNLPAALQVTANAAGLAAGQYTGTITVNVPLATPATRQINVTLSVPAFQVPKLSVGNESVSFKVQQGTQPTPIGLGISNQGGGTLNYTATLRTATGGNWLTVSQDKGQLSAGANATLNLAVSPGNLAEGTYSASVSISDGSTTVNVPVTVSITRPQGKLLLSQVGLSFTAVEGGGTPASQTFGVLNEGSGELPFEAKAILRSGDAPIRLNNATGRLSRPLQDVSFVEVGPDTRNLTPGEYDAEIRITSPGLPPQTVIVKITVLPRGSNPGPEVRPTGLVFIGTPGSIPRSEDVNVFNITATHATYVSSSQTFDGAKWISHLPSAATIYPNEPRRIVVQPDFTGITPGVKRASLNLLFEDGTSRTVSILSIVPPTAPVPNKNGTRQATGCSSPSLRAEFLSLPEGSVMSVGQPVAIEVKVVDDCGNLLLGNENNTNSGVYAKFSNGDTDVRLVPIGNGVWAGTWRPLNPAAGGVTISAIAKFVQGQVVQDGQRDRTVRLTAGANVPIIRQLSLVNSASQKGDTPVAPGTLVTIYGSNLANSSKNSGIPLPLEVDGTQVLLSGQPLPILNSSPNQINMQIPYDTAVNTSHQIVVRRGNSLSVPVSFNVASAQPGIFTRNSTGTGQGVVMGPDQITMADSAKPAQRGQAIVIYCTGPGAVTPSVVLGAAAPSSPLAATVNPVEVVVGEKKAQVLFSGLTPGFSGLYQINAVLAADTPTGEAVPLTISTSGQTSSIVTIAVR